MEGWSRSAVSILAALVKVAWGYQGMPTGVGVWDKAVSEGKELGGDNLCHPLEMGAMGMWGLSRCSAAELEMRLENQTVR